MYMDASKTVTDGVISRKNKRMYIFFIDTQMTRIVEILPRGSEYHGGWWPGSSSISASASGELIVSLFEDTLIQNSSFGIRCEISPRWMLENRTNEKSPLVRQMAWFRQATSQYLSQCWL